jgi:hypothetical protein
MKDVNKKNFIVSSIVWYFLFKILYYATFMGSVSPSQFDVGDKRILLILMCLSLITVVLARIWLGRLRTLHVTGSKAILAMTSLFVSLWGMILNLIGTTLGLWSDRFEGGFFDYFRLALFLAGGPACLGFFFYLIFKPAVQETSPSSQK